MRKIALFLTLSFLLVSSGCFFGTFQTARTLEPGEVDAGWYINYPLYFTKAMKDSSKSQGYGAFVTPNIGGYFGYGTSGFLDIGLKASLGEGIGPFAKWQITEPGVSLLDIALYGSFGYQIISQGITFRTDLILSKELSRFASFYFGWTGVRSPDYRKMAYEVSASDIQDFQYFHSIFLGVRLKRRADIGGRRGIPSALAMEFAIPLRKYPPLFFGFQITR